MSCHHQKTEQNQNVRTGITSIENVVQGKYLWITLKVEVIFIISVTDHIRDILAAAPVQNLLPSHPITRRSKVLHLTQNAYL